MNEKQKYIQYIYDCVCGVLNIIPQKPIRTGVYKYINIYDEEVQQILVAYKYIIVISDVEEVTAGINYQSYHYYSDGLVIFENLH